jgi:hypothetical protein
MREGGGSWLWREGSGDKTRRVDGGVIPPLAASWKAKLKLPRYAIGCGDRVAVICHGGIHGLDLETGREVWAVKAESKRGFELTNPAANGKAIYLHGARDLRAVRWEDGEVLWSHKMKYCAAYDRKDPLVSGRYALFGGEVRDAATGGVVCEIGKRGAVHRHIAVMTGSRIIRQVPGENSVKAIRCERLEDGHVEWETACADRVSVHMANDRYVVLSYSGPEKNVIRLLDASTGAVAGEMPEQVVEADGSLKDWTPAGLSDSCLFVWAEHQKRATPFRGGEMEYYARRAEAYHLPRFNRSWSAEQEFRQSGFNAHVGCPSLCLVTGEHFWLAWRDANSERPKSTLTALSLDSGTVAYETRISPWVEHLMSVSGRLILVGRGGTVFCYKGAG